MRPEPTTAVHSSPTLPNPGRLYVCRTCVRDARVTPDGVSAGALLASQVIAATRVHRIEVRVVECLNACPSPCNVALRGSGKRTYRFSRVGANDVAALIDFTRHYIARPDGCLDDNEMPLQLVRKLTAKTPPPAAVAAAANSGIAA